MTVDGPIEPEDVGICLTHEHITLDGEWFSPRPTDPARVELFESPMRAEMAGILRRDPVAVRDNATIDQGDLIIEELRDYRELGGSTMVEVTPPDIGRNVERLRQVSSATGLNIVAGTAHYVESAHPTTLADESVEHVAERFLREISEGIGEAGIKPGIIGEIGVSVDAVHPGEKKVLRAAARVQAEIGIGISVHLPTFLGHEVLDILEQEGADLSRVVLGHCDTFLQFPDGLESLRLQCELAARGCYIAYDTFGHEVRVPPGPLTRTSVWNPSDGVRIKGVAYLLESGLERQILISQDVCMKMNLLRFGGFGYGNVLRNVVPELVSLGFGRDVVDQIMIDNPRRLLAF